MCHLSRGLIYKPSRAFAGVGGMQLLAAGAQGREGVGSREYI